MIKRKGMRKIATQQSRQRHGGVRNSSTAQLSNSREGGTAGDSRVGGNGEATTITDSSASTSRVVMVATKGGVGNSNTIYSHAVNCNYPTKHQRRASRYSNRKNAAISPKKRGLTTISQRRWQRGARTPSAKQRPQRTRTEHHCVR